MTTRVPFRLILAFLAALVLLLAFVALLPLALSQVAQTMPASEGQSGKILAGQLIVLAVAFMVSLLFAFSLASGILARYVQAFYDLPPLEAEELSRQLAFGPSPFVLKRLILNARDGKLDTEGPAVLLTVGGPGHLSVAHNSVVVTSRLGKLHRILGPGFHALEAFEKVWDVVDLRPQRGKVTVEFMTRDGIPASCEASIVCRVKPPEGESAPGALAFRFDQAAVLKIATSKYVRSLEGSDRVSSWVVGMTMGALDGAVRDALERHRLDEFLNPQYWELRQAAAQKPPSSTVLSTEPSRPKSMSELEAEIEADVRQTGEKRGIVVEKVELGPVIPDPEAVSQQWMEYWQAKLQREVDSYDLSARAKKAQLEELARAEAQANLVKSMVAALDRLAAQNTRVPPELIVMSFMDVLYSMTERSPGVQQMMVEQMEGLAHILSSVRKRAQGTGDTADEEPSQSPGPSQPILPSP